MEKYKEMESIVPVMPNTGDAFDTSAIIAISEKQEHELLGHNRQIIQGCRKKSDRIKRENLSVLKATSRNVTKWMKL